MMPDHEEEIPNHIANLDWNGTGVAQSYKWLSGPFRNLDKHQKIQWPVDVPRILSYAILELVTYSTAGDGPSALLFDATAWVPEAPSAPLEAARRVDRGEHQNARVDHQPYH